MNTEPLNLPTSPMHVPALAAVFCTSCKAILYVADPMKKFTRYRKVTCPHCGQPHRMDLYFQGERDCFNLVQIRHPSVSGPLDEDD